MGNKNFSVSKLIKSPPQIVYSIIADYNVGHPEILPKPPFISLDVEKGGVGEGTEMVVKMEMFSKVLTYRAVVTEPEPGKTLIETTDTGFITTFSVNPENEGKSSFVTFTTETADSRSIIKKIEFFLISNLLKPVYTKELESLAETSLKKAHTVRMSK